MASPSVAVPLTQLRDWHRSNDYNRIIDTQHVDSTAQPEAQLLLALSLAMSGDTEHGFPLLREQLQHTPDNHDWRSDHALGRMLLGDVEGAVKALVALIRNPQASAVDFSRLAAARLAQQQEDSAAEYYREAIDREPGREHWHYNLAGVLVRLRRLEEALDSYDSALRINPQFEQAINARRELLLALERCQELAEELQAELDADPENYRLRLKLANALTSDGRFTDALSTLAGGLETLETLHQRRVSDAEAYRGSLPAQTALRRAMAELWSRRGRHGLSFDILRRTDSLQDAPDVGIRCQMVHHLLELNRLDEADALLQKLLEDFSDETQVKLLEAQLMAERGDHAAAETGLRAMLEQYPGNPTLLCNLGQSLMWTGQLDEAAQCFERAGQMNPLALAQLVRTRRLPDNESALERMREVAENPMLAREARAAMNFALAEASDARSDFQSAAAYLQVANQLTARDLSYQPEQFEEWVARNIDSYSHDWFNRLPAIRGADRQTVFVVGMPRSGTTLAEQILAAHPQVFGAGELDLVPNLARLMPRVLGTRQRYPECIDRFTPSLREEAARYYLHGLEQYDRERPALVDKLPHNFVHLGLIASILPNAKIIHLRRDPRDVALSNYQQNFKARHGGMGFAFDLEHIGRQLNQHQRIMDHWRATLPLPIFDLHYEALVADQAEVSARMLEFLSLEWDDSVLKFEQNERAVRTASVSQVREPIYQSSSGKWRRYEAMLAPLMEALDPAVLCGWD